MRKNCLSVLDHFVGLALKGLKTCGIQREILFDKLPTLIYFFLPGELQYKTRVMAFCFKFFFRRKLHQFPSQEHASDYRIFTGTETIQTCLISQYCYKKNLLNVF